MLACADVHYWLWVDEVGGPVAAAARLLEMHGAFRVPTLLRRVDKLCRTHATGVDASRQGP